MGRHTYISFLMMLRSEVSTLLLLSLNGFKERLKVACAETLMVPALNDFEEKSRSILKWLSEDLEQVTLVVVVDEDFLALEDVNIFLHLDGHTSKFYSQVVVVGVGDLIKEKYTSIFHTRDRLNDVFSAHGNMLNARSTVVITELLNLTLSLALSRFIDRHLNLLIKVSHHHGSKRAIVRVDHLVIDRPEAVKIEHLFIPLGYRLHFTVRLVADNVIDV